MIENLMNIIPILLIAVVIVAVARYLSTDHEPGSVMTTLVGLVPVVIIVMVAAMIIPSLVPEDNDFELYDCVPVSTFGNGATIEGDCAEIVTIGDEQYVRMTDLGTFTVASGGVSKEYEVTKAKLDLVLLTGQSNSLFFTAPSFYTEDSPVAPGKAFYFGTETPDGNYAGIPRQNSGTLDSAQIVDVVADDGSVNIAGMYPSFCSDYVEETGHRVLVINTGVGGQPIYQWLDGYQCDVWMTSVFERLDEVLSGKVELNPTVALWSQGESDAAQSTTYYKNHLVPLLEKLWDGDYGYEFDNVLSVLPRHDSRESPTNPALAQMSIADQYSGFTIASSLPIHFTSEQTRDGIHYKQTVYNWLGEAFARSAAKVMGYSPVTESLVLPVDVGVVETLPSTATIYGTSGEGYAVPAQWTVTDDPSIYTATFSNAPPGTGLIDGLSSTAYPSISAFYTYSESGTAITGLTSAATDASILVLPNTYSGNTITEIGANAFQSSSIEEVYCLADTSITTIGASAFQGCSSLTTVSMPEATKVSYQLFKDCILLETVDFESATTASYAAFQNCKAMEEIELPSLTATTGGLFLNCLALSEVSLPAITELKANDFQYCMAITSVSFGSGLTAVASNTFPNWTFYDTDGTTELDKTVASNLAGHTFAGTASALVKQS